MSYKFFLLGFMVCIQVLASPSLSFAANDLQRLRITYSSLTAAYTPLWLAVEQNLGRKHGLDLEAIYLGRGVRPHQVLLSGGTQYVASTGTGVVASHAAGIKDLIIIASLANTTGASIFANAGTKTLEDLRGKIVGSGRPGGLSDTLLRYVLKRRLRLDLTRDVTVLRLGDDPTILPALERGLIDAAVLSSPARWIAKKLGFTELLDFDEFGLRYPYVGISTLKATLKKNPATTAMLVRTLVDGIHSFRTEKRQSLLVMKRYLGGVSEEILEKTYAYFVSRIEQFPYPSIAAIQTALDVMSDQYPTARNVNPHDVVELSFLKEIERNGLAH
jgi:ABC-type nitrate/sulfonate/bicarbonate transport system substrate-binding protein